MLGDLTAFRMLLVEVSVEVGSGLVSCSTCVLGGGVVAVLVSKTHGTADG